MRPVCFLSDFGLADDFAGTCKGVMLRIAPGVSIVDLTHEVPGFEVEAGGEILPPSTPVSTSKPGTASVRPSKELPGQIHSITPWSVPGKSSARPKSEKKQTGLIIIV